MFPELNATDYNQNKSFYNAEFEDILSKIILCYHVMLSENIVLTNNENSIRDYILLNYLKKQVFKEKYGLTNYLFDRETIEDNSIGRIDIRVMPVNPFVNDDAYYIIECKRLDSNNPNGISGLNAEYIQNGIYRFISKKYSMYYKTNAMIGFVIESMDIEINVSSINGLLTNSFKESNTTQELSPITIVKDFNFSYFSKHTIEEHNVIIYHLMFDFSKNVE